ncbi:MAG: tetratricopeptide repeat protein [Candidatus Heimdallarchaeaceae archaeon]|jgi:tetratricopeptide (TPR) repeat protein
MGLETGENSKTFETELVESLIDTHLFEEALPFLDRLLKRYGDPYFIYLKGKVYFLQNNFKKAIKELSTVTSQDTDFWQAYELLGEIYRLTSQYKQAENYYFKAASLNPRATQSWLGRGQIAMDNEEFQIAILSFETYLRINREDAEVWKLLARSYREADNPLSAIDAYNEAIEIEPTNQDTYEELGDLYLSLGRSDIAKEKYMQALQVEEKTRPVKNIVYHKLAELYLEEGQNQKAFNLCNELLVMIKDDPEALFISGKALVKLGQRYEGIVRIKRAIERADIQEHKDYLDKLNNEMYGPKYR